MWRFFSSSLSHLKSNLAASSESQNMMQNKRKLQIEHLEDTLRYFFSALVSKFEVKLWPQRNLTHRILKPLTKLTIWRRPQAQFVLKLFLTLLTHPVRAANSEPSCASYSSQRVTELTCWQKQKRKKKGDGEQTPAVKIKKTYNRD